MRDVQYHAIANVGDAMGPTQHFGNSMNMDRTLSCNIFIGCTISFKLPLTVVKSKSLSVLTLHSTSSVAVRKLQQTYPTKLMLKQLSSGRSSRQKN